MSRSAALWVAGCLAAFGVTSSAFGVIGVSNSSPSTENFNSYMGTSASVPIEWLTTGNIAGNTAIPHRGTLTSGSSAYSKDDGWWSLNDDLSPYERAFGARVPSSGIFRVAAKFRNDTGKTINRTELKFNIEQFTLGAAGAGNNILVEWSPDGTGYKSTNLSGDTSTDSVNDTGSGIGGTVFGDPLITNRVVYLDQEIAPGGLFCVRFTWTPSGTGNRPHWGIDDVSVNMTNVPIPEPAAISMIALGAVALLGRRRK